MNAELHKPRHDHERVIWDYLNAHPHVTYADVFAVNPASQNRARVYLAHLRRTGILRRSKREGSKQFYTILDTEGVLNHARDQRTGDEAAIWQAMRALGAFSVEDISAALASVGPIPRHTIQAYCLTMVRIRYASVTHRDKRTKKAQRFRLNRDTGPLAPIEKRMRVVIDRNEDRIVYAGGERL